MSTYNQNNFRGFLHWIQILLYRFWYELGTDPNTRFTLRELKEIRKVTMARIICDNTRFLFEIQPSAFRATNSRDNPTVHCDNINKIPKLDIIPFQGMGTKENENRPRSLWNSLKNLPL